MAARKIKTLVKSEHTLGNDKVVLGRILGAMAVMCKEDPANGLEFGRGHCDRGIIIVAETTEEKYSQFTNVIERWYPGLCIFDYVE